MVVPISPEGEKRLITSLIDEINKFYGMGIDPNPSLERGCVTQGTVVSKIRTVLVGASHMTRLADEMGGDVVSLAFPGFRPKEKMLTDIASKLSELKLGKKDTVVVDLLSNVVFMGTDGDGLPTEARRAEDGSYHVVGSLTIAPPSLTKKVLAGCSKIALALKETGTVLVSPIPRYVFSKCCDNPEHIENFEDLELDEEIVLGLEGVKKIMQNWAIEHDLCFEIIDPTMLADPCDLGLRERTTSSGQWLWRQDDPVHLSTDGYKDIDYAIMESVVSGPAVDSANTTGSTVGSQKRKRAESVVTKPQQPPAKKTATAPRTAGWLLGRLENNANQRGRGFVSGSGGRTRGHGGRAGGTVNYDRAGRRGGFSGWHGGRHGGWHRRGSTWKK
jgi:hypothetical protein